MIDLNNDRESPIESMVAIMFENDWKAFIKGISEENRASNCRLLKAVAKAKGAEYMKGVKHLLQKVGTATRITFANKAKGMHFSNPEWNACGKVMIDQRSTAEGMQMEIYIPVKPGKYLYLRKYS
jgi:hypothetical protein